MAYSFLLTGWENSVRNICGVSSTDVPDTVLGNDLFATETEDQIKRDIPNWNALKSTYGIEFNRAAIFHLAAKACQYLAKKLSQSETIGDYRYDRVKTDWQQEAKNNLAKYAQYLLLIDPNSVESLDVIEISPRIPALYDEFEVIEE